MVYQKDYFGFVYKWTNKETGKFYIGSHFGSIDDGYVGSGVYFKRAYDQNHEIFQREIIEYITVNEPAAVLESEQNVLNAISEHIGTTLCYNISTVAGGGWQLASKTSSEQQTVYEKISETLRNKSPKERAELNQRVKDTLIANPKIKQEAIKKQKETKSKWTDKDKKRISNKLRLTLEETPDIITQRVEKFKQTMKSRSKEDKQKHSDRIKQMWEKLSDEEKDQRITAQRQTISTRTDREWNDRREKYRKSMSKKTIQEIEEAKNRRVSSFKNRTPEQKTVSETKRLTSKRANKLKGKPS